MSLRYERNLPESLLQALEPTGFAHGLVEYGRSGMFGLDLQLRGRWVTLYIGTTKALDLHATARGGFKLTTAKSYANSKRLQWHPSWTESHPANWFAERWDSVESYLDRVIASVNAKGKHLKEGIVQSAVSRFPGNEITMIDREAVISYDNEEEKRESLSSTSRPWLHAVVREDTPPRWWNGSRPTRVSTECDLLGITPEGELITIEVKPSSASVSDIAWSPLQARQYANQFQAWLKENGETGINSIYDLMRQQQRIGIRAPGNLPTIDHRLPVKAIVVIDARVNQTAMDRLGAVVSYLQSIGCDPKVEIRLANLVGRLLPDPSSTTGPN